MMNSLSLWERAGEKVQSLGKKEEKKTVFVLATPSP
jgi:hypothetical protein